jgi:hypothetical protein
MSYPACNAHAPNYIKVFYPGQELKPAFCRQLSTMNVVGQNVSIVKVLTDKNIMWLKAIDFVLP